MDQVIKIDSNDDDSVYVHKKAKPGNSLSTLLAASAVTAASGVDLDSIFPRYESNPKLMTEEEREAANAAILKAELKRQRKQNKRIKK